MTPVMAKFLDQHYHLAVLVLVVGAAALFTGRMSGGQFIGLAGPVLAAFRVGDAFEKWVAAKSGA